jgi:hypothetical protein
MKAGGTKKGKTMHYKNGREAKDGDQVIGKGWTGDVITGRIIDLNPGATSCNCTVVSVLGEPIRCQTVGELYHAADALRAVEQSLPQQEAQKAA